MHRMTILYGTPADPAAFDHYYREVHIPIARRMKGLTGWTMNHLATDQDPSPYHLVVDLYAESRAAMDAILASPEGRAASADVPNFATGGVTFLRGEEEVVPTW
ncbi:EthD family reductase [Streptomyces odontomachi]|uniref:EthD family reductase n=1 Tax=Streptomyces odontomachi TaxID=2944940 RepID=UPI002108A2C4|nr:EthD family reductase [Streptomyces sp. ODS25]